MKATRLLISGIVQGVGFRYFTLRAARHLGLSGYVRNLRDGRVEAVASGEPEAIEAFVSQMRQGPRAAQVSGLEASEIQMDGQLDGFEIRD